MHGVIFDNFSIENKIPGEIAPSATIKLATATTAGQRVSGRLTHYGQDGMTLAGTDGKLKRYPWSDFSPDDVQSIQQRAMNKAQAEHWGVLIATLRNHPQKSDSLVQSVTAKMSQATGINLGTDDQPDNPNSKITYQTFDSYGTPYEYQFAQPTHVSDGVGGAYLRLTDASRFGSHRQNKLVIFDRSFIGPWKKLTANFDLRIKGKANNSFTFHLFDMKSVKDTGRLAIAAEFSQASNEPAKLALSHRRAKFAEIDLAEHGIDLGSAFWRFQLMVKPDAAGGVVSLTATKLGSRGITKKLVDSKTVVGLYPYESQVALGAGGNQFVTSEVDNIIVTYSDAQKVEPLVNEAEPNPTVKKNAGSLG
jgi:hypothetical protein